MKYALFLDDERIPKTNRRFIIARSYQEAVAIVEEKGLPSYVSFDHDLGAGPSGYDFAKYLVTYFQDHAEVNMFEWNIHSANPVGAHNINSYLNNFVRYLDNQLE